MVLAKRLSRKKRRVEESNPDVLPPSGFQDRSPANPAVLPETGILGDDPSLPQFGAADVSQRTMPIDGDHCFHRRQTESPPPVGLEPTSPMVKEGIEPSQDFSHRSLKPGRLPNSATRPKYWGQGSNLHVSRTLEPKSSAAANYATPAKWTGQDFNLRTPDFQPGACSRLSYLSRRKTGESNSKAFTPIRLATGRSSAAASSSRVHGVGIEPTGPYGVAFTAR